MKRPITPVLDVQELLQRATGGGRAQSQQRRRKAFGRTVRHDAGRMNKLEAAYAAHLAAEQSAGRVIWFAFEALKLRLADRTTYEPDFVVLMADGSIELHEVKGHWEDDARVKWKAAGEMYFLFHFVAVTRPRGVWTFERY